jgi:ABC-type branched-subunit amino acid transport system substrate-binding protein
MSRSLQTTFLSKRKVAAVLVAAVAAALVAAWLTPAVGGAATPQVATASNGTINIAGLGYATNFADAGTGAAARFQRANQDKEVKGYKFDYKEFADDKNDPATSLAETRRLVTQDGILALVPDVSTSTPSDYLTQQKIPWFGPGYDNTYCPPSGSGGFGFSTYGCLIPENPKVLPGPNWELLKKELASKGNSKPTVALIGTDQESGKQSIQNSASTAEGAGFDVVYAKGAVPAPPAVVSDYTPYAQALLSSNNGKQPDVIYTSVSPTGSLNLIGLLKDTGYTGTFLSPFYVNLLLKPLAGAYVFVQFAGFEADTPGIKQMVSDVQAFKPGAQPSLTLAGGYFAADMFIQAVKNALKTSKTLTSASVQQAASKMTYQIKDTIGPTQYPASYKYSVKACATLEYDADGTAFAIAQPYFCTTKTYPILPKYAS